MKQIIIGIVALMAVVGLFTASSLGLLATAPEPCEQYPYQQNCYCPEGYEKLSLTAFPLNRNVCQYIDVTDPDDEATTLAKAALTELFVSCDSIACGSYMVEGKTTTTEVSYGQLPNGIEARVECKSYDPLGGLPDIWWSVHVDMATGEVVIPYQVLAPFCTSLDGTTYR